VGRGVARIDSDFMDSISASTGDVVEIGRMCEIAKESDVKKPMLHHLFQMYKQYQQKI
jgi:hypothetical protein